MHIATPQSGLLSNHELLLHLQAEEAEYTGTDGTGRARPKPSGLKHMLRDGLTYLQDREFSSTPTSLATQRPQRPATLYRGPHSLLRALAPTYRLNKAEYLQLYNLRPTTQIMLQLVIEEAGARFSDAQQQDILSTLQRVFDEEESQIPADAENAIMNKIPHKMLGVTRKRRKGRTAKGKGKEREREREKREKRERA